MSPLNELQTKILINFIQEFLPQRTDKRKNSGNKLEYITSSLDRVFKQNFGFNLSMGNVLDAFKKLEYYITEKNAVYDSENKKHKPSITGNVFLKVKSNNATFNTFTYININPQDVRALQRTVSMLPKHTNSDKLKLSQELKDKILDFKNKIANL